MNQSIDETHSPLKPSEALEGPAGEEWSAQEAAAFLGVKRTTLYAYVSRGLLRSLPAQGKSRARRYLRADVEALRDRNRGTAAAASALRFGEPVLDSGITEMREDGPAYRGRPAVELAEAGARFETVAEWLWRGVDVDADTRWPVPTASPRFASLSKLLPEDAPPASVRPLILAAWAARDPGRFDPRPEALLPRARAITRLLAASLALPVSPDRANRAWSADTIAEAVLTAYGLPNTPPHCAAVDALLVLMADHELNASTFATRVAASAHADVYAAVQAGLATLSGPLHGGASDQVEAMLQEIRSPEDAARVVHERGRRGEHVPGFGHLLYREPQGDPRARALVGLAAQLPLPASSPRARECAAMRSVIAAMAEADRPGPNVDAGAVVLRAALGMPPGAVAGIFTVGRSVGWVAHILEQVETGQLLRPRARYTGPPVAD